MVYGLWFFFGRLAGRKGLRLISATPEAAREPYHNAKRRNGQIFDLVKILSVWPQLTFHRGVAKRAGWKRAI
jgi:hypothetical protein